MGSTSRVLNRESYRRVPNDPWSMIVATEQTTSDGLRRRHGIGRTALSGSRPAGRGSARCSGVMRVK